MLGSRSSLLNLAGHGEDIAPWHIGSHQDDRDNSDHEKCPAAPCESRDRSTPENASGRLTEQAHSRWKVVCNEKRNVVKQTVKANAAMGSFDPFVMHR